MRFLLASLALATVLVTGGRVRAEDRGEGTAPVSDISPTGRCLEQPMSLAMAIAEYEASRALPSRATRSEEDVAVDRTTHAPPVAAPVMPRGLPPGRTCLSPTDPGCHIEAPAPVHASVHLERADHGTAPAPALVLGVSPPFVDVVPAIASYTGRPLEGHRVPRWRPPRA